MLILAVFLLQKKTRYQFVSSMINEGNKLEQKEIFHTTDWKKISWVKKYRSFLLNKLSCHIHLQITCPQQRTKERNIKIGKGKF